MSFNFCIKTSNLEEKEKVAIIIPTLNRKDFILRAVAYYTMEDNVHPLYIGDASSKDIASEVKQYSRNSNVIKYYHVKGMGDRETMIFLAEKASKDNNKYCAFQGDDDFFIVKSLSKAAMFLKDNNDYRTAQGNAITVELNQSGAVGEIDNIGKYWSNPKLNSVDGMARMMELSNNYWVPNFSVHRTKEFIDDFTDSNFVKDRNWGEITNCFSCAIKGKSKYLDIFYLVRNVHAEIEHPSDFVWKKSKEWGASYEASVLSLADKLSKHDSIDLEISKKHVIKIIDIFLQKNDNANQALSLYEKSAFFLSNNNYILRSYRKIKSRFLLIFLFFFRGLAQNPMYMRSKYSKYHKEFVKINQSIFIKNKGQL